MTPKAKKEPMWKREGLRTAGKMTLIPALLAAFGSYLSYRTEMVRARAEAGYATTAPALTELQEHVKALSDKVDLHQRMLLGVVPIENLTRPRVIHGGESAGAPAASLDQEIKEQVKIAEKMRALPPRPIKALPPMPKNLDEAFKANNAAKK